MERLSFEKLVQNALKRLPRRFKRKLGNISIVVEEKPTGELLRDMEIESGTLFGLYQGVPLTERGWNYGNMLPDRIVIFQRPIEEAANSPAEIEEIVMDTVIHEVGHYFGFSDDTLYEIENKKMMERRREGRRVGGQEE